MEPDLNTVFSFLDNAGIIGFLVAVLVGGGRQWWVFGHHYRELKADRDQWKALALQGTHLSRQAVDVLASSMQP